MRAASGLLQSTNLRLQSMSFGKCPNETARGNALTSPRASSKQLQRPSAGDRALGVHVIVPLDFESAFPMSGLRTLSDTIVRVLSTVCNHGQVSRGCMIMQSTTRHSKLEANRCRQSTACVSIDQAPSWESIPSLLTRRQVERLPSPSIRQ